MKLSGARQIICLELTVEEHEAKLKGQIICQELTVEEHKELK